MFVFYLSYELVSQRKMSILVNIHSKREDKAQAQICLAT